MSKPLKVLIVEDSESDTELLLLELKRGDYDLFYDRVDSSTEFQAALGRNDWDIILSDHSLPRFSSLVALSLLKQSGRDIPFIIISGAMGEEAAVAALKSGADDYLVKGKLARLIPAIERELREANDRREKVQAERALAESERKYRQIIETTLEGVWVIDAQNKTTFLNQQMADMLGYPVEQVLGQDLMDFMDTEAREHAEMNLDKGKGGQSEHYDFRFLRRDGGTLWAWLATSPIFDADGRYSGAIAMVTDITKRKWAEETVRESEARFRNMADAAPIIISTTNSEGVVDYINKAGRLLVGMSMDSLAGNQWLPLIHPDDQQVLVTAMGEAVQKQSERSVEYRTKDKNGQYHWLYTILSPRFTESGEFSGLISCTMDISERKQAEEALARNLEKERLISRIVEFNSQSLSVVDILNFTARELGIFLAVDRCLVVKYQVNNQEAQVSPRIVGAYEKNDTIAKVQEEDIPTLDITENERERKQNYKLCLDFQEPGSLPAQFAAYFAKYQVRSILLYDVSYRGVVYGRIALHQCDSSRIWQRDERDIVENVITHLGDALYQLDLYEKERAARYDLEESYKLLEVYTRKVEQSNLELENFATIASHDLQGPLRKVITFGDMLALSVGDQLSAESLDYLERMKKATLRMQVLITDLLDLSRINRKGKPFQRVALKEVVSQTLDDLSEIIQASGAEIEVNVQCVLSADQDQLRQVLTNLIENGIKFARSGMPPRLKIVSETVDGRVCLLHVIDNGIGIKSEYFDKIFEVFTRLHGQEAYPGTGIGLSLVKKIIERHQGEITVSSVLNSGSTFTIRLPLH